MANKWIWSGLGCILLGVLVTVCLLLAKKSKVGIIFLVVFILVGAIVIGIGFGIHMQDRQSRQEEPQLQMQPLPQPQILEPLQPLPTPLTDDKPPAPLPSAPPATLPLDQWDPVKY